MSPAIRDAANQLALTRGLLVNSAGNDSEPSPGYDVNVTIANRQSWLFVGAVEITADGVKLSSYSNAAGSMMDRYVVAPGTNTALSTTSELYQFSGTSSAAPIVAALAADILSKWPQLTGQDAGNIILNTATDLGEPGVDPVYGHGLVNFKAALSPINPMISNGSSHVAISASTMTVPEAMNAQNVQEALSSVTVVDEYGRDYDGTLAPMIQQARRARPEVHRRVAMLTGAMNSNFTSDGFSSQVSLVSEPDTIAGSRTSISAARFDIAAAGGTLSYSINDMATGQADPMGLAPLTNAVAAYAPQVDAKVEYAFPTTFGVVTASYSNGKFYGSRARGFSLAISKGSNTLSLNLIAEDQSVFGALSSGALTLGDGAKTLALDARRNLTIGAWNLSGFGSVGITRLKHNANSLITDSTLLTSTRFGMQALGPFRGGILNFGIAQPLNIETGQARLTYGSGYDLDTQSLRFSNTSVDLAGNRALTFTAGYSYHRPNTSFRMGIAYDANNGSAVGMLNLKAILR